MTSPGQTAPRPTPLDPLPRLLLRAAGASSVAIALLHVVIILVGGPGYRYFGAGEEMARAAEAGSLFPAALTAGIAMVFLAFGCYAFSATGIGRRLPLLRAGLVVIGLIFTLRGLAVFPQAARGAGLPVRWVVFSAVSLGIGVLYLAGIGTAWSALERRRSAGR